MYNKCIDKFRGITEIFYMVKFLNQTIYLVDKKCLLNVSC